MVARAAARVPARPPARGDRARGFGVAVLPRGARTRRPRRGRAPGRPADALEADADGAVRPRRGRPAPAAGGARGARDRRRPGALFAGEFHVFSTSGTTGRRGVFPQSTAEFDRWVAARGVCATASGSMRALDRRDRRADAAAHHAEAVRGLRRLRQRPADADGDHAGAGARRDAEPRPAGGDRHRAEHRRPARRRAARRAGSRSSRAGSWSPAKC